MGTTEIISLLGIVGGIVGTLLGTLAGTAFRFWVEKRRWNREDQTRFRDDLYQACMKLDHHAQYAVAYAVADDKNTSKAHVDDFVENYHRFTMLGSTPLVGVAEELYDLTAFILDKNKTDEETRSKHQQTRESFREKTRAEPGIRI